MHCLSRLPNLPSASFHKRFKLLQETTSQVICKKVAKMTSQRDSDPEKGLSESSPEAKTSVKELPFYQLIYFILTSTTISTIHISVLSLCACGLAIDKPKQWWEFTSTDESATLFQSLIVGILTFGIFFLVKSFGDDQYHFLTKKPWKRPSECILPPSDTDWAKTVQDARKSMLWAIIAVLIHWMGIIGLWNWGFAPS